MVIDTRVAGDPDSLAAAAQWLSGPLAAGVREAHEALRTAVRRAEGEWHGLAGDAFAATGRRTLPSVDELADAVDSTGAALAAYAQVLRETQRELAAIRDTARAGGLPVSGYVVHPPTGAGLAAGDLASVDLYERLEGQAIAVRTRLAESAHALDDDYRGLRGAQWPLNAGQAVTGFLGSALAAQAHDVRETAAQLKASGDAGIARVTGSPAGNGIERFYDDLDHYRDMSAEGVRKADSAEGMRKAGVLLMSVSGFALTTASVGYEVQQGKPRKQAVAAGAAGFVAGVGAAAGTGAAIGAVAGPPGAAAGAVIGTGVGTVASVFASGAVDAMFEEGPGVGTALSGGWEATADTSVAAGEGVVDGVKAIGDGFGSVIGSVGPAVMGLAGGGAGGVLGR